MYAGMCIMKLIALDITYDFVLNNNKHKVIYSLTAIRVCYSVYSS
jgi:hypothetical protein